MPSLQLEAVTFLHAATLFKCDVASCTSECPKNRRAVIFSYIGKYTFWIQHVILWEENLLTVEKRGQV